MRILFTILAFIGLLISIPIFVVSIILGLLFVLPRGVRAYKNWFLASAALSLGAILLPLGFIYAFFKMSKDEFVSYIKVIAISLDQTGNVLTCELLDDILTKDGLEYFGNPDETVSSRLGKLKQKERLSILGRVIDFILDLLDPNHSIKSIEEEEK